MTTEPEFGDPVVKIKEVKKTPKGGEKDSKGPHSFFRELSGFQR